jgi:hypothetical protein
MHRVAPLISSRYAPLSFDGGQPFARAFAENLVLVFEDFFETWAFDLIADEGERLAAQAVRRDVFIEESKSWRHMTTLGSQALRRLSSIVPYLYTSQDLADFLSGVAGERVLPVPDANEQFVLNCLERCGDYHGAHLDTYSFAFNIILQTPPPGAGGVVTLSGARDRDPAASFTARSIPLRAGDAYFMRTNMAVHGVSPLAADCRRLMFNFAYRSQADIEETSYSSSKLYA